MKLKQVRLLYKKVVEARIEAYKKRFFEREFQLFQAPSISWFGIYQERLKLEAVPYRIAPIQGHFSLFFLYYSFLDLFGSSIVVGGLCYLFFRAGDPSRSEQPTSQPTSQPASQHVGAMSKVGNSLGESSSEDLVALTTMAMLCVDLLRFLVYGLKHGWMWKHCRQWFKSRYGSVFVIVYVVSLIVYCRSDPKYAVLLNVFSIVGVQYAGPLLTTTYLVETSVPETWDSDLEREKSDLVGMKMQMYLKDKIEYALCGEYEGNFFLYYLFCFLHQDQRFSLLNLDLIHSVGDYFAVENAKKNQAKSMTIWESAKAWLRVKKEQAQRKKAWAAVVMRLKEIRSITAKPEPKRYQFSSEHGFVEKCIDILLEETRILGKPDDAIGNILSVAPERYGKTRVARTSGSTVDFNPVWLFYFWEAREPNMTDFEHREDSEVLFMDYEIEEMALTATDEALREWIEDHDAIQKVSCSIQQCWKSAQQCLSERCSNRNAVSSLSDGPDEEIAEAPFSLRSKPSHS